MKSYDKNKTEGVLLFLLDLVLEHNTHISDYVMTYVSILKVIVLNFSTSTFCKTLFLRKGTPLCFKVNTANLNVHAYSVPHDMLLFKFDLIYLQYSAFCFKPFTKCKYKLFSKDKR